MNINIKTVILLGIAILIAVGLAMTARGLIKNPVIENPKIDNITTPVISEFKVLVATKKLPLGYFLKRGDYEWRVWPAQNINENFITNKMLDSNSIMESFAGSVIKNPVLAGIPLLKRNIVHPGNRGFLAAVLKKNHRAFSIRINAITGISGFIFPGDRVDIILTHSISLGLFDSETIDAEGNSNRKAAQVAETVLKNIRVLAIDQRTRSGTNDPETGNPVNNPRTGSSVTFELTPKQTEKIALVSRMGSLSLALRSLTDFDKEKTRKLSRTWDSEVSKILPNLPGHGPRATKKSRSKKTYRVEVVRGTQVKKLKYVLKHVK